MTTSEGPRSAGVSPREGREASAERPAADKSSQASTPTPSDALERLTRFTEKLDCRSLNMAMAETYAIEDFPKSVSAVQDDLRSVLALVRDSGLAGLRAEARAPSREEDSVAATPSGEVSEALRLGALAMWWKARAILGDLEESLQEGLMTDAGLTPDDRAAMHAQADALGEASASLNEQTPADAFAYASYMLPEPDQGRLKALLATTADKLNEAITRAETAEARLGQAVEALSKLILSASLLQQNSEACAAAHHGVDLDMQGMPGWLIDTARSIEAARTITSSSDHSAVAAVGEGPGPAMEQG